MSTLYEGPISERLRAWAKLGDPATGCIELPAEILLVAADEIDRKASISDEAVKRAWDQWVSLNGEGSANPRRTMRAALEAALNG